MTTIETITCPEGMTGLACEPWGANEIHAVAANWSQASSPVMIWGDDGWDIDYAGRQVADFRHSPREALMSVLADVIECSGDDPDDVDVESMVAVAAHIDDRGKAE